MYMRTQKLRTVIIGVIRCCLNSLFLSVKTNFDVLATLLCYRNCSGKNSIILLDKRLKPHRAVTCGSIVDDYFNCLIFYVVLVHEAIFICAIYSPYGHSCLGQWVDRWLSIQNCWFNSRLWHNFLLFFLLYLVFRLRFFLL